MTAAPMTPERRAELLREWTPERIASDEGRAELRALCEKKKCPHCNGRGRTVIGYAPYETCVFCRGNGSIVSRTTLPAALDAIEALERQIEGHLKEHYEVDQALGKALGYPTEGPEVGGDHSIFCTGEHTPASLAAEAANKIDALERRVAELEEARAIDGDCMEEDDLKLTELLERDQPAILRDNDA